MKINFKKKIKKYNKNKMTTQNKYSLIWEKLEGEGSKKPKKNKIKI